MTNHVGDFVFQKRGSSVHDPNSEYMFMAAVNTAKKPRLAGTASSGGLGREETSFMVNLEF